MSLLDLNKITSELGFLFYINPDTTLDWIRIQLNKMRSKDYRRGVVSLMRSLNVEEISSCTCAFRDVLYCHWRNNFTWQYYGGDKTRYVASHLGQCFPIAPLTHTDQNNHHSFTPLTKTLFLSQYFQNWLLAKTFSDTAEDCSSRDW